MSKKPKKRLTPGQVLRARRAKAMAEAVRSGNTTAEVAAAFGMTETTVRLACEVHKVDFPRRKRGPKPKTVERKPLAEAVRNGQSISEVVRSFGAKYFDVQAACFEHQVEIPRDKQVGAMRILARIVAGKKASEISQELSISRQRISQVRLLAEREGVLAAVETVRQQATRSTP